MTLLDAMTTPLLIYGIGNVGRQDDGLGPLLVEQLESHGVPSGVTLDSGYQLLPEDALLVSRHASVIFVDATSAADADAPYSLMRIVPAEHPSFTSHTMRPEALLALCQTLYGAAPPAFTLAIPARLFGINEPLSAQAAVNLDAAVRDLRWAISTPLTT